MGTQETEMCGWDVYVYRKQEVTTSSLSGELRHENCQPHVRYTQLSDGVIFHFSLLSLFL